MSVRGYATWKPAPETAWWIVKTNEVLDEYRDYWPLTVRQLFYRLVANHGYEKTEQAYNKLTGIISRSRRAGLIEWAAIRDGGQGKSLAAHYYEDADDFYNSIREAAKYMMLDRQRGQENVIELWCEAGGMVPILRGIAAPYSARVNSGGGYDSVTSKHRLAIRVKDRAEKGLRTIILHVGDFDGSGEDMANVLRDDAGTMAAAQVLNYSDAGPDWVQEEREAIGGSWSREAADWAFGWFDVQRVALTGQQVVDRNVETAPPKKTDSRSKEFIRRNEDIVEQLGTTQITAQLEALTPPELEELLREAIEEHLDMDAYERVLEDEQGVRTELIEKLDR